MRVPNPMNKWMIWIFPPYFFWFTSLPPATPGPPLIFQALPGAAQKSQKAVEKAKDQVSQTQARWSGDALPQHGGHGFLGSFPVEQNRTLVFFFGTQGFWMQQNHFPASQFPPPPQKKETSYPRVFRVFFSINLPPTSSSANFEMSPSTTSRQKPRLLRRF